MSQQTTEAPADSTALVARTNIMKAEAALTEFDKIGAGLAELRGKYEGVVFDVKTTTGMSAATKARAEIRAPRYATEKVRKEAKAPVLALGRNIDERAKWITEELLKIETPIHEQIAAEEQRKEAEREARILAEQERVARIQAAIEGIRAATLAMAGQPSATIARALEAVRELPINGVYGEFQDVAEQVKAATIRKLTELHAAALAQEQEAERQRVEAERLRLEREELDRRAAEQEKREREERARIEAENKRRAEEEAAARRKIEEEERAARARIEEEERQARLQREAADREARLAREAEERKARELREAEEARLKEERERLEAERRAAEERERKALEEAEARAAAERRAKEDAERQEREQAEAKARAERDAEEAKERERLRKEGERMDASAMLMTFRDRFGHLPEFAKVVKAINACLAKAEKQAA